MDQTPRAAILGAALAFTAATAASAQSARDLAGTWSVVSAVEEKAGNRTDFFGPNPRAMMMFDGNGHFMQIIMRDDLPRIAANGRALATEQEAEAVLGGSTAYYGTYTVPSEGKLVLRVERSIFANWNGMEQQRTFAVNGDELTMANPANFNAGDVRTVWRRVR